MTSEASMMYKASRRGSNETDASLGDFVNHSTDFKASRRASGTFSGKEWKQSRRSSTGNQDFISHKNKSEGLYGTGSSRLTRFSDHGKIDHSDRRKRGLIPSVLGASELLKKTNSIRSIKSIDSSLSGDSFHDDARDFPGSADVVASGAAPNLNESLRSKKSEDGLAVSESSLRLLLLSESLTDVSQKSLRYHLLSESQTGLGEKEKRQSGPETNSGGSGSNKPETLSSSSASEHKQHQNGRRHHSDPLLDDEGIRASEHKQHKNGGRHHSDSLLDDEGIREMDLRLKSRRAEWAKSSSSIRDRLYETSDDHLVKKFQLEKQIREEINGTRKPTDITVQVEGRRRKDQKLKRAELLKESVSSSAANLTGQMQKMEEELEQMRRMVRKL